MAQLASSLVLNKYILSLFGVTHLEALAEHLKDPRLEGYDENNISRFYYALNSYFYNTGIISKELLLQYDQNIFSHTQAINRNRSGNGNEPVQWKYFQYLCLLFTEIYLDKYFSDKKGLLDDLNAFLKTQKEKQKDAGLFNQKQKNNNNDDDFSAISDFRFDISQNEDDLNKLAYWNATGSGKTLLMHLNILQYQHYLEKHQGKKLDNIILLTPNEGLSRQHLQELQTSNFRAELFTKSSVKNAFAGNKIGIIDIHKLEEKDGEKTIAVENFEGNNFVLVDEGHRGTGGEIWKEKRNRLCANGFSFEYSATFGQSVSAISNKEQKQKLLDEYGKATIFDYSYKYFYNDGFGKDYQILNLDEEWHKPGQEKNVQMYLTASLMTFYEQLLVFRDNQKAIAPFNIEKPLAIFVGGKVTAVRVVSGETQSDVVEILKFLADFVKDSATSIKRIDLLQTGKDNLKDNKGNFIFGNALVEIKNSQKTAKQIFDDMLKEVFNTEQEGAHLHVDNLKGQSGEIGLRIGNADYFGIINVGDDAKLLKICADEKLQVGERDFSKSLFADINRKDSKINVLIGSKKFTEGWSSWRVSMMGLLNIGRGEGSEIIQLFGRGVRLKGLDSALKRSKAIEKTSATPPIPSVLPLLETLNIFGLRADYMLQFKAYLEEEGLTKDKKNTEIIEIPMLLPLVDMSLPKLKYLGIKSGVDFKKQPAVKINISAKINPILLNWYAKIKVLKSAKTTNPNGTSPQSTNTEKGKLTDKHLAFLDWNAIYFEIQKFKNERSWYNSDISLQDLKAILANENFYTLEIPATDLEFGDYKNVQVWQELAISLLKKFVEKAYNKVKNEFYSKNMEVTTLQREGNANFFNEYIFEVEQEQKVLISKLKELKTNIEDKNFSQNFQLSGNSQAIYAQMHLYQPLIYIDTKAYSKELITIRPVALNEGEYDFVEDLKRYFERNKAFFEDKKLYLLRNTSRKGIGFFETNNFYPDFILWLVVADKQYISFIDPKGLRQVDGMTNDKIMLHKKIKEIETQISDKSLILNSFIVSNTPYKEIAHWKGQENMQDFNAQNVYFQNDQKEIYIEMVLKKSIR